MLSNLKVRNLVALTILLCTVLVVSASPLGKRPAAKCKGRMFCKGVKPVNGTTYLCGDARLGPKNLPNKFPLDDITHPYDRLGGLCAAEYLKMWTNEDGSYKYPPKFGFQLNTADEPIQGNVTLLVGTMLDRFGSEYGSYMSPAEAPYPQRALPPSNLATSDNKYPNNYHVYRVKKEFVVLAGPIAAWFEQPGAGVQYYTYRKILDLLADGLLEPVALKD
ncbi:hypothetical protein BGZ76_005048 [Entomortierella beljakovae]|nr:hypothetical protein BGZ76_005048 [Entomortierella beljakovae]